MGKIMRKYDAEFKEQAVKLAEQVGITKAANELGMPENTLYGWRLACKKGKLTTKGPSNPGTAVKLADELAALKSECRELKRKNAQLEEENEILAEATRFFASRQKK